MCMILAMQESWRVRTVHLIVLHGISTIYCITENFGEHYIWQFCFQTVRIGENRFKEFNINAVNYCYSW